MTTNNPYFAGLFGTPGDVAEQIARQPSKLTSVNSEPLGAETGAPPQTLLRTVQVVPESFLAANSRETPTQVVQYTKDSRSLVFLAPLVGFSIFIGDTGVVNGTTRFALPAGQPYEVIVPGNQQIYAVTDAPIYLPLKVQIAPLLIGDRQRNT